MRNYSSIPVLTLLSASFLLLPLFLTSISTGVVLVDAANWGWGSNEETATIKNEVEIDASATGATRINSDSIQEITHSQKRYVLYNSRRLTGECRKSYYLFTFGLVVPLLLRFLWCLKFYLVLTSYTIHSHAYICIFIYAVIRLYLTSIYTSFRF
jgi:hypothetical protein